MDSTSLLFHLLARGFRVTALSIDYGQKHRFELECVRRQCRYLKEVALAEHVELIELDLSAIGNSLYSALTNAQYAVPLGHYQAESMKQTVVPNRNSIFFSLAAAVALSMATRDARPVKLSLAVHSGDHEIYPDCRPEFYDAIWHSFQMGNWDADQVELYLPYLNLDKAVILSDAAESIAKLELDFDRVFRNTCTSYMPNDSGISHGLTGSDVERILAFHAIGRQDPIPYQRPWEELVESALTIQANQIAINLDSRQKSG